MHDRETSLFATAAEADRVQAPAAPAVLSGLQRELLGKMEVEAAMVAAPHDQALRGRYFDLLQQFASTRTGLSHVLLPELGHPLYFRCGSSDVSNLAQIFRDNGYGFATRATPRRILDLGAYAGYAAVYLARRFPQAEIMCVEPGDDNFRLLTLNTAAYRRIHTIHAAAWHTTAKIGVGARYYGDWGTQLRDTVPDGEKSVQAYSVQELLKISGWRGADLVKCDIEGSEYAVFSDPGARWLELIDVLAIELHDTVQPGATDMVAACFPPDVFERTRHGEAELFQRRVPLTAVNPPAPRELYLINCEPGLFPFALRDVSRAAWGFFTFDGDSCQLHPNPPVGPVHLLIARLVRNLILISDRRVDLLEDIRKLRLKAWFEPHPARHSREGLHLVVRLQQPDPASETTAHAHASAHRHAQGPRIAARADRKDGHVRGFLDLLQHLVQRDL